MTISIYRDSATQYRVGYDTGSGIDILDTITITQTAAVDSLYVGVEAYGGAVRNFDNLEIGTTAEQPTISNFSISATTINEPGQVTFTWSVTNACTVSAQWTRRIWAVAIDGFGEPSARFHSVSKP